ncbi:hypothetical protein [Myroides fluvii]|uniref:hypothetical protein n=1 Tax=Myroides fluvii TaxID=2572594 RepID=UPI00131C076F|nr:hypothetical protein [Myroides fluvii]
MKKALLLASLLYFSSCSKPTSFENHLIRIDDLKGFQLDSMDTGGSFVQLNGKQVDEKEGVNYLIFKKESLQRNNYLRIHPLQLNGIPMEQYLHAHLEQLRDLIPPFTIQQEIRDTIIQNKTGVFYSILISQTETPIETSYFLLKSDSGLSYEITSNLVKNDVYDQTKKAHNKILSTLLLK